MIGAAYFMTDQSKEYFKVTRLKTKLERRSKLIIKLRNYSSVQAVFISTERRRGAERQTNY